MLSGKMLIPPPSLFFQIHLPLDAMLRQHAHFFFNLKGFPLNWELESVNKRS
jgi:hypothetical protein